MSLLSERGEDVGGDLEAFSFAVRAVLTLLEGGAHEEAARSFMETIAFGPGAWEHVPAATRGTWVHNAPTFLEENRDPTWASIDIGHLGAGQVPLQLSYGSDLSGAFRRVFRTIVRLLAEDMPEAHLQELSGTGHVPAVTHPELLAEALFRFISRGGRLRSETAPSVVTGDVTGDDWASNTDPRSGT